MMEISFLAGFIAAGFAVVAGSVMMHVLRPRWPMPALMAAWLVICLAGLAAKGATGDGVNLGAYCAASGFAFMAFFFFFSGIYKSLSVRIIIDLLSEPEFRRPYQDVLRDYILQESFAGRVRVLKEMGFAQARGQGLEITARGLFLGRATSGLQRLFGIRQGG